MKRLTVDSKLRRIRKDLRQRRTDGYTHPGTAAKGKRPQRASTRRDAADDGEWITIKGTHVLINENGEAQSGGKLKGMTFNRAKGEPASRSKGSKQGSKKPQSASKTASHSKIGEILTGKSGKLAPKTDAARRIETKDALDEIKGGKDNSLKEHIDKDGNLTPERQKVHDEIIKKFFADKVPYNGKPSLVMSGGGPASGKTFIRKSAEKQFGEDTTVTVDPDKFKEMLPGYEKMACESEEAAGFYHEESSALAKRAYQFAVDNGINVVYDGTGDGSVNSVKNKIAVARSGGYAVKGSYVTVDTEEALIRNKKRYESAKKKYDKGESKIPPRLPEESLVRKIHQKVTDISIQVAGEFDEFELYDNNGPVGSEPVKIATSKRGQGIVTVKGMDEKLQKFLNKGKGGARVVKGRVQLKS